MKEFKNWRDIMEWADKHGAENTLWTLVRTLSTDNLKELVNDIKWALGE